MPVISANIGQKTNRTNFCAASYTVSSEAEKVIRKTVAVPQVETRGLLTSLLAFLQGDKFLEMVKGQTCHIETINFTKPKALHLPITEGDVKIQTINSMLLDCKLKSLISGLETNFMCYVEKTPNAQFTNYNAVEICQKDKEAAEELLKNVAVCK